MKPLHEFISSEEQRAYADGYDQGQKDLAKLIMETFKQYEVPMLLWEALKEY